MEEFCYAGNPGNSNFDQREILWSSSQNYDDYIVQTWNGMASV